MNYKGGYNVANCPLCRTSVTIQKLSIEELIKNKKQKGDVENKLSETE